MGFGGKREVIFHRDRCSVKTREKKVAGTRGVKRVLRYSLDSKTKNKQETGILHRSPVTGHHSQFTIHNSLFT
jgi:hypothetical protein